MTENTSGEQAPQQGRPPVVEEQARAIMQAVPDLVFLLGMDGRYIDIFSARDEDLFIPREELIGRTVSEVLPPPVGDDCMAAIHGLSSRQDVTSFSYVLEIGGKPRWFEGRVTQCDAESVLVLVRDFTEQRLAEEALTEANLDLQRHAQQLQRLSRQLTLVEQRERQRMAQLLHDNLQQLLVGAKYNVAILANRTSPEGAHEAALQVNEVLDEAIRQSQALTMDLCPPILYEGSLDQILQWVASQMKENHGLTVELAIEGPIPGEIAEEIRFVCFNAVRELLFNVVKHSGKQKARVAVAASEGNAVCITVSDEGNGFATEDPSPVETEGGGFGLFAIRERIEAMGGRISVDSQPGSGCRVTIQAPTEPSTAQSDAGASLKEYVPAHNLPAVAAESEEGIHNDASIRVLLVDDHAVLRQGISLLLREDPGFYVVGEAEDGASAIELVRQTRPDVVLMDISMPGMNGIEATRLICAEHPDIKVIGLSMYDEKERGKEIMAAGAAGYITKSDPVDSVTSTIRDCCGCVSS